jgi:hypothetical protein
MPCFRARRRACAPCTVSVGEFGRELCVACARGVQGPGKLRPHRACVRTRVPDTEPLPLAVDTHADTHTLRVPEVFHVGPMPNGRGRCVCGQAAGSRRVVTFYTPPPILCAHRSTQLHSHGVFEAGRRQQSGGAGAPARAHAPRRAQREFCLPVARGGLSATGRAGGKCVGAAGAAGARACRAAAPPNPHHTALPAPHASGPQRKGRAVWLCR